jgi:hypothetical protein
MDARQDFLNSYFSSFKVLFPELTEEKFLSYYDDNQLLGYPELASGSMFTSEGRNLYTFIRLLKPKSILEIGNFKGVSTNHILKAVEDEGIDCRVVLVDIFDQLEYDKLINRKFTRIVQDSHEYLSQQFQYQVIIQDGCHTYDHVSKELSLIQQNNQHKNYYVWGHDYHVNQFTANSTCEVRKAYDEKRNQFEVFLPMIDSYSNCGIIITKFK